MLPVIAERGAPAPVAGSSAEATSSLCASKNPRFLAFPSEAS
jgi:hypothetical protein